MLHYNILLLSISKWWFAILGIGLFFFAIPVSMGQAIIGSGDITFTEDVTLNITVNGSSTNLIIPGGSTANEVIVNASSVEITKGSEGHISINSPGRLNLENDKNLQTACDGNQSKLTITIDTKVIITPTSASDHCAAALLGGGSGGSSGGGGSTGGSVAVTTPSTVQEEEESKEEKPKEEEPMFKDIGKLKKADQAKILQMVQLMLDQKTYKVPATKKYRPGSLTNGYFSLQIWNAAAGIGCGSDEKFPGIKACKKKAVDAKLISGSFKTGKKVARIINYEALLNARNIELEKDFTGDDLEEVCSDVKKGTKKMAQVYFTARQHKIALKYKGNKCKLGFGFSRKEAAKFAVKALAVENDAGNAE